MPLYKARTKLPAHISEHDIAKISAVLAEEGGAFSVLREAKSDLSPWVLEWITPQCPAQADLTARLALATAAQEISAQADAWIIEEIPETNWLERSYQQFPAFSIGPFFIYGSHHAGGVPDEQIGLQIDAATAFGSGEHGTTSGCLRAMLHLKNQGVCPWNVLDMGTGSGILAIAAYKLWKTPVLAVDNDAEAVRVAARHCTFNQAPMDTTGVTCDCGDGFKTESVQQKQPFDLIIANILAGPLKDMAEELASVSDDNGYVVLSGILDEQAESVIASYAAQGMALRKKLSFEGWSTLILQNAAS
jgi:ribosomal protein L11 methyltransferase